MSAAACTRICALSAVGASTKPTSTSTPTPTPTPTTLYQSSGSGSNATAASSDNSGGTEATTFTFKLGNSKSSANLNLAPNRTAPQQQQQQQQRTAVLEMNASITTAANWRTAAREAPAQSRVGENENEQQQNEEYDNDNADGEGEGEEEQEGGNEVYVARREQQDEESSAADDGNETDDEDDDDDDDDDDENDDDDDDVGNENDEENDEENDDDDDDDDSSAENSSVQTTKGVRKYNIDDFQIIKIVGTGTFGRVCLCRDRVTQKYCAMKIMAISEVIRLKQIDHVKNERDILREIRHPFVISLEWSTKDSCCLFMIFEYVCGGELFSYLRNSGKFTSPTANFYAAEIVSALEYLHALQIVYRDLKPENLLLGRDGHLKITDFGFSKKLRDRTWTLCGTPEYLAPEIIQSKGHNRAVDWWALGVLIYEMIAGCPPFYDENPFGIYEKILSGKIDWPRHMDPIAKDLIKKLLVNDRTKRLGNMKNGAEDVKRHRWFKSLNWNDVYNKKLMPPIIPVVKHDGDTSNFDDYSEKDWKPAIAVDQRDLQLFIDF